MPWPTRSPMDERVQFISDHQRQRDTMVALCDRYGISRKTGYKWLERYDTDGPGGLATRSSRPHTSPQATPRHMAAAIVAVRRRYPSWGGKKILAVLAEREPTWTLPAVSTANDILKRHDLVPRGRRRRPRPHPGRPAVAVREANDLWTADFKGQFRTGDAALYYPLTICDAFSRYLLDCRGLRAPTWQDTMRVFHQAFRVYGLPRRIQTDNGEPFASWALGRLSRLSVWWIRLAIEPVLIEPASPQQNGAHERMHRTLKAETTRPPAATRAAQQRRFRRFRHQFNHERPHEALQQRPPARLYTSSSRPLPTCVPPLVYPGHYELRRVTKPGVIWWHSRPIVVSTVLIGEQVALEPVDDALWDLHFGPVRLGRFDERRWRIDPAGRRMSVKSVT
jgi:putative transposase